MTIKKNRHYLKVIYCFTLLIVVSKTQVAQVCSYTFTNNYATKLDTNLVYKTIIYFNVQTLKYDTMDLKMDIVKPIGDNNTKRPIVIYFHGANEPYKYNQLHVKRMVDVMVKERGFILASVDYKIWALPYIEATPSICGNLLFLLNGIYSPYDIQEPVRAGYRIAQDANDAIKFVKARSVADSSCKNLCFISGFSAGGLVAYNTAFISAPEKPIEANTIIPANYTNLFGSPLTTTVSLPRNDLGVVTGTIVNGTNTNIKGVVIFNSGIQNLKYIKASDPSLFIYHSTNDPNIVADSSAPACFTDAKMYGQNSVKTRAISQGYILGTNLITETGATLHDFYNTQIRKGADFISNRIDVNNCLCDSTLLLAVNELKENANLNFYCNNNQLYIKNTLQAEQHITLIITDIIGKMIRVDNLIIDKELILPIALENGLYIFTLNTLNQHIVKKMMIQN